MLDLVTFEEASKQLALPISVLKLAAQENYFSTTKVRGETVMDIGEASQHPDLQRERSSRDMAKAIAFDADHSVDFVCLWLAAKYGPTATFDRCERDRLVAEYRMSFGRLQGRHYWALPGNQS